MIPEERDRVLMRLQAAWPKPIADATALVWCEHLNRMSYDTAMNAVGMLERTHARQPALSDFHEAYAACRAAQGIPALQRPKCSMCDLGWISTRCLSCDCATRFDDDGRVCPHFRFTVEACPNGCLPPAREEARPDDGPWLNAEQRELARGRVKELSEILAGARPLPKKSKSGAEG